MTSPASSSSSSTTTTTTTTAPPVAGRPGATLDLHGRAALDDLQEWEYWYDFTSHLRATCPPAEAARCEAVESFLTGALFCPQLLKRYLRCAADSDECDEQEHALETCTLSRQSLLSQAAPVRDPFLRRVDEQCVGVQRTLLARKQSSYGRHSRAGRTGAALSAAVDADCADERLAADQCRASVLCPMQLKEWQQQCVVGALGGGAAATTTSAVTSSQACERLYAKMKVCLRHYDLKLLSDVGLDISGSAELLREFKNADGV